MAERVVTTEEIGFVEEVRRRREGRGMSKKALAAATNFSDSRIRHVEGYSQPPNAEFARKVDSALDANGAIWQRWEAIADRQVGPRARGPEPELRTVAFVGWLADHSGYSFQALYAAVCDEIARINAEPASRRLARVHARQLVGRADIAAAMRRYYGADGFYSASVAGVRVDLGVLTRREWLDVAVPLAGDHERLRYVPPPAWDYRLDDLAVAAAVARLASVEIDHRVMVNNPLYRLLDVQLGRGYLDATVTTVPFAEHAMTSELMEGETLAAVMADTGELPLRDRHLPSTGAAFDLAGRACVGGPTTLLAVARKRADGERDYVVFAQERSNSVFNLAGKLAVIPKGFHQPTGDAADEAALSSTLRREFEEELLGRQDLEQVNDERGSPVDLHHPRHRTAPFAWLLERPSAWWAECTGLGFNMLTANYEFACLVVVEDEAWWDLYSGHLVTNWESDRIDRYSTREPDGLAAVMRDPRWGNESLFSVLQGLRRLTKRGDPVRLNLPSIELIP